MARALKPQSSHHKICIREDFNAGEIILVSGRRRAYLWVGQINGAIYVFSGPQTLRSLAKAILKEIPPRKR